MSREEELVKYQLEQHQRNQEIDKATQNMSIQERAGFVIGVDWADQHPRKGLWDGEKVVDWLNSWFTDDICQCRLPITKDARNTLFNDLRKAMEE